MNTLWNRLDFFGDGGALLKATVPDFSQLPGFVKTAKLQVQGHSDREDPALVLESRTGMQQLYPASDPGNTAISTHYLLHNHALLPEEAVKVAAMNLGASCAGFKMPVPGMLQKLAGVTSSEDFKWVDPTVHLSEKIASAPPTMKTNPAGQVKARVGGASLAARAAPSHYVNAPKPDVNPKLLPMAEKFASYEEDKAVRDANQMWRVLHPLDRVKVASAIYANSPEAAEGLCDEMKIYATGVVDTAKAVHQIRCRRQLRDTAEYRELEKVAHLLSDEELVHRLWVADENSGVSRWWNSKVDDPLLSVYTKLAAETPALLEAGTERVAPEAIEAMARNQRADLVHQFGESFADQFQKNPLRVFNSLPEPTKELIARMVDSSSGPG